jgi:hypothetical protein
MLRHRDSNRPLEGAKSHFEVDVMRHRMGPMLAILRGKANPDHVFVGADFRKNTKGLINPYA